jgi:predicted nucleotidyltransferase
MNKREAVAKLKRHADAIKAFGATSLYVFGSVARDQARTRSDLDLFIDYDPDGKFYCDFGDWHLLLPRSGLFVSRQIVGDLVPMGF